LGLIGQGADEAADPPVAHALVMLPPSCHIQHPARVPDGKNADPLADRPADHFPRCLILGLTHPPHMTGLRGPLPVNVGSPPS
jgi:hypothetical protein